jgi:hypothetical protein
MKQQTTEGPRALHWWEEAALKSLKNEDEMRPKTKVKK